MNKKMILSVGMPRAGTGWLYNITQDLVIAAGGIPTREIRKKYKLEKFLTEVNCNIGTISSYRLIPVIAPLLIEKNYVIKLHGGRRFLADIFISTGVIKATYMYRDPRDAALSIYEYGQIAKEKVLMNNEFSRINTIEGAIEFIEPYIDIARDWISSLHVLVIKYEDMFSDFDNIVQSLINFLQLDLETGEADTLMEAYRPGRKIKKRKYTHFIKGKIGRHKEYFTSNQLKLCEDKFGDFLREHGYSE